MRIEQQYLTGERALFRASAAEVVRCTFADGESPLKEARDVALEQCLFKWKYPIWYADRITMDRCTLFETARSGIWYTRNITVRNSTIEAPKTFRRSADIRLEDVNMPQASETLWNCERIALSSVCSHGDYFAMNSRDITADRLRHTGNYIFDGASNVRVTDSVLVSKDAFWNCENVYVKNSEIYGEYLGWNSRNVVFENCLIESLQGLCYMDNVRLIHCRLINTTLAFEFSVVDATVTGSIDSVFDPRGGRIVADRIGTLIQDPETIDPSQTEICAEVELRRKTPLW